MDPDKCILIPSTDKPNAKVCEYANKCVLEGFSYKCECGYRYSGAHCEFTPCDPDPCENESKCSITQLIENDENLENYGFECECSGGYSGERCEIPPIVDACNPNNPCQNGGECNITVSGSQDVCHAYELFCYSA